VLRAPTKNEKEQPPTASSIRGTDAILQAANHVIALHRERSEFVEVTDAIILKNRSGQADVTIPIDTALNICFFAEDMNEALTLQRQIDRGEPATQSTPDIYETY